MKNRKQDHLRLFDLINKAKTLPDEKTMKPLFGSDANYFRVKSNLCSALLDFLPQTDSAPDSRISLLECAARESFRRGAFGMMQKALHSGAKLILKHEVFDRASAFLHIEKSLPGAFRGNLPKEFAETINKFQEQEEHVLQLEDRLSAWPEAALVPPPKIELLDGLLAEVNRLTPAIAFQRLNLRLILLKRRILTLSGNFQAALHLAKLYMKQLRAASLPLFEQETLLLNATATLSRLLSAQERHAEFLEMLPHLLPVNFTQQGVKVMAFYEYYLNQLFFCADFGIDDYAESLLDRAELQFENLGFHLSHKQQTIFAYQLARYQMVMGRYKAANQTFRKILQMPQNPVQDLYRPYILLQQAVLFVERGETDLAESILDSLRRLTKKSGIKYKYFSLAFKVVQQEIRHFGLDSGPDYANFQESLAPLQSDSFEGRPFNHFNLLNWVSAKAEGKTFQAFLHQDLPVTREQLSKIAVGWN